MFGITTSVTPVPTKHGHSATRSARTTHDAVVAIPASLPPLQAATSTATTNGISPGARP